MQPTGHTSRWMLQISLFAFILSTSLIKEAVSSCHGDTCPSVGFFFAQSGVNVVQNHALYGHGFLNLTVTSPKECFRNCSSDCRCISFNCETNTINASPNNCQLNEENRHLSQNALKPRPGFNYYDLVIDYNIKDGKTNTECNNQCCKSQKCQNGGKCNEKCDVNGARFNCTCPPMYTGKYCETQKAFRTCHEVRSKGVTTSGIYPIYNPEFVLFSSYCDFDSEEGSSWTLIESFSLANNARVQNLSFYERSSSVEQSHPNWDVFRLAYRRNKFIGEKSTHWRATCNFEKDGVVYTDYIRARLEDNDPFVNPGHMNGFCATYELVNIRNKSCVNCTALTFHHNHLHIDSYHSGDQCEFDGKSGATTGEDNFGTYSVINPLFRCTTFQNSTTQFWIGSL